MIIEKILKIIGIHKCHYCKKYIFPWQKSVGYFDSVINVKRLQNWKPYSIYAKYLTHKGKCTEMDIKNEEND